MNQFSCPYEEKAANAARTDRWEDAIRIHVQQCAHSREVAGIAEWMKHVAATDAPQSRLPEARQLFLNPQMAAIQAAQEKALRPLAFAELIVRITVIFIAAGASLSAWLGIRSLVIVLQPSHLHMPQPLLIAAAALIPCLIALLSARMAQPVLTGE